MTYKLAFTKSFGRELKKLKKKYPSILADLDKMGVELLETPSLGDPVYKNCYKIRIPISSMNKGKSGSARVITYVLSTKSTIFLVAIFTKAERSSISEKEINELIKGLED
jgi:mRNA-degrading endonuclease RelE of RelBE toxin-antitoxin system